MTHVIAEMACSHDGSAELARQIIDGAGAAGADAIQFQVWTARDMVVPSHPALETLLRIELDRATWAELAEYSRGKYPKMQIIGCVYELPSADFCASIGVDAFKIHSADLANPALIRHVASTGRRIDLSVGASTIGEIQQAVEWIRSTSQSQVWLMYGYQSFPTPTDAIHLRYLATLRDLFELPVGYQDHSDADAEAAFWLPAAAMGVGVQALEKHITHDRSKKGIDHEAALNPDEFARFVEMVHMIDEARGDARPRAFSAAELQYRTYARKSIVAARALVAGHRITEADLAFLRAPQLGLPPDRAGELVGRRTRTALAAHQLLALDHVEGP